jgi:hypothetical protein
VRAKSSNCKTYTPLALALPLRSAVLFMNDLVSPLKTDHPRVIDRVIDFFGERPFSTSTPPPTPANLATTRVA